MAVVFVSKFSKDFLRIWKVVHFMWILKPFFIFLKVDVNYLE